MVITMTDEGMPNSSSNGAAADGADPPPSLDFDGAQAWLRNRYADDPVQQQASLDALHQGYTGARVDAGMQKILAQSRLDTAIDRLGAGLRSGIDTPEQGQALVDQIADDTSFDPEARSDAYQALRNHVDALAAGAPPRGLGPQFLDALDAFAKGAPVAKDAQLKMLAHGGLTPDGFGALNELTADPSEARLLRAKLLSARAQLVSGPNDTEGQAIFDDHFLPTFFSLYQMGRGQGKQPLDLLDPTGKEDLAARLLPIFAGMRTPTPAPVAPERAMGPTTTAEENATAPEGKIPAAAGPELSGSHDLERVDGLPIKEGSNALPYFDASFAGKVKAFFDDLRGAGIPVLLASGFRTSATQATLTDNPLGGVAAGHSLHEAGYAFDINWERKLTPDEWSRVLEEAGKQGFAWGGNFRHRDVPHFYLDPFKDVAARRAYIPTAQKQYQDLIDQRAPQ